MTEREPYRPSNGTEGEWFMERWCYSCMDLDGFACPIIAATLGVRPGDEGYPDEWRQDGPAGPRCTAYRENPDDPGPLDPAAVVRPLL